MDLHDVAWGRQSVEKALRDVDMPCLSIGVTSDILYPAYQQQQIADAFIAAGAPTEFVGSTLLTGTMLFSWRLSR